MNEVAKVEHKTVLQNLATRYEMTASEMEQVLAETVLPKCSRPEAAAFMLVAWEHKLNPLLRQIYAFPKKGGGLQVIVPIDGWMKLINEHKAMDGMEFQDHVSEDKKIVAITCRIFRKDRSKPTEVTEYMNECRRDTDMWKKWPARMLRHKAAIQCARYAFGISEFVDPDEWDRIDGGEAQVIAPAPQLPDQNEPATLAEELDDEIPDGGGFKLPDDFDLDQFIEAFRTSLEAATKDVPTIIEHKAACGEVWDAEISEIREALPRAMQVKIDDAFHEVFDRLNDANA